LPSEKLDILVTSELSVENTKEHFDLTAQSSSAPSTESDSIIVHKPEEMILQIHLQHNQSVQSQDVPQNRYHPPEALNLQQSVMDRLSPLVIIQETDSQNMPKESADSEAISHEQQNIHTHTEQDSKLI